MSLDLEQLKATFEAAQDELAEIFKGAFGIEGQFDGLSEIEVAEGLADESLAGPGLVLTVSGEKEACLLLLRKEGGLLVESYASPDPTQRNIVRTLAQEVGFTLLPESFGASSFDALVVDDLTKAIQEAGLEDSALWVRYSAKVGEQQAILDLLSPCSSIDKIEALAPATDEAPEAGAPAADKKESGSSRVPPREALPPDVDAAIPLLPTYTKSLLRINVPVTVKLAETKQPVKKVVEMNMGSIIQFEKSCEEPLVLEVAGHPVALGEAVKVGDKFGLRITSISLPPERFGPIQQMS